jgi:serine/threonine protein kinase
MEYVDGKDLRETLKRQARLGVNEAIDIIMQVFSGLAASRREGIIHRDLNLGNVMQDAIGRVVLSVTE